MPQHCLSPFNDQFFCCPPTVRSLHPALLQVFLLPANGLVYFTQLKFRILSADRTVAKYRYNPIIPYRYQVVNAVPKGGFLLC